MAGETPGRKTLEEQLEDPAYRVRNRVVISVRLPERLAQPLIDEAKEVGEPLNMAARRVLVRYCREKMREQEGGGHVSG